MMRASNSSKSNGLAGRLAPISLFIILLLSALGILNGCSTLSNGRGWGKDAKWNPGWTRIKSATINAALSPETWGTVAAALVLQIDNMDERISDWASDHAPIFGSQDDADKWSDYLRDTSGAAYLLTTFAAPSGEEPFDWTTSKVKALAIGATAWGVTAGATELLKDHTERTRPDKSDNRSFPSGHVSSVGSFTTLGRRNISNSSLSPAYKKLSNLALYSIAAGTAWARVEAKKHYPSDALVGYAIGHFCSSLINDAFFGDDTERGASIALAPSRNGMMINFYWVY